MVSLFEQRLSSLSLLLNPRSSLQSQGTPLPSSRCKDACKDSGVLFLRFLVLTLYDTQKSSKWEESSRISVKRDIAAPCSLESASIHELSITTNNTNIFWCYAHGNTNIFWCYAHGNCIALCCN